MVERRKDSRELYDSIVRMIEIDGNETFSQGRRLSNERDSLRARALEIVDDGADGLRFPKNSNVYVTLKRTEGRICWKKVAEYIARKNGYNSEKLAEICNENRGDSSRRLTYGTLDDGYFERRVEQADLFVSS